jgi:hypothetical protein
MTDQNFAQVLRQYLDTRKLPTAQAAALWNLDPDTLHKILRGEVSVPRTKVGFWSDVLEMPEAEILAAVNRTRAQMGRPMLQPIIPRWGRRIDTVEQTRTVVTDLQAADAPAAAREAAAADVAEVHDSEVSTSGAA